MRRIKRLGNMVSVFVSFRFLCFWSFFKPWAIFGYYYLIILDYTLPRPSHASILLFLSQLTNNLGCQPMSLPEKMEELEGILLFFANEYFSRLERTTVRFFGVKFRDYFSLSKLLFYFIWIINQKLNRHSLVI